MERRCFVAAVLALAFSSAARAELISVQHTQRPMHQFMVARSPDGKIIARCEFSQTIQGDEVMMHLTYRFIDGSLDDETTTYSQKDKFRLVSDYLVQKGPFFSKPVDFTVVAATGMAISRTTDRYGKMHIESEHMNLPDDLANGFVGTLLLNVPENTAPFQVETLAPVDGGRLIHLLISPEGEQPFRMAGQTLKAMVFRIHPELGGLVGMIVPFIGLQPKDVMVWVLEGKEPDVVRIVGQLDGYGPVVSSELEGASFGK